jgi:pyridoxine/pyridoxamine 5'-phosphate oxidase
MDAKNLADLYDLPLVEWQTISDRLAQGFTQAPGTGGPDRHTCWLATLDPDGRPHVTGVGAFWDDGGWWIVTSRTSRKGRNMERDPRCSLAVALTELDLSVEGEAALVEDPDVVARIAQIAADDGWPARPDETGTAITAEYSAPSAGPPPWHVYRITPTAATALVTVEPGGATRWRF